MLILFRKLKKRSLEGLSRPAETVLVTGASSGIGMVTALHLAENGHRVIGTGRSIQRLSNLQAEASERGLPITCIELDINRNESVNRVMPKLIQEHGPIDVLVNNAGYGLWGPIESLSIPQLKAQFEANLFGAIRMIDAVLPDMTERRNGKIINISSVLGRIGTPFNGAYASSKFALEGMSESLRAELSPFGVHVSLVEPGLFRTQFQENQVRGEKTDSPELAYAPYISRYNEAHDKFQRFGGDPIRVAKVIRKIIASSHPGFRYPVGLDARAGIFGARFLPEKIYWSLMTRATMK